MNAIKNFVGACSAFLCMSAMAANGSLDVGKGKVVAIQMCAISTPASITYLQVVFEGKLPSVSSISFNLNGDNTLNEAWESSSLSGQSVASYWGRINNDSLPSFVIVDNQVLPLEMLKFNDEKWTEWVPPMFKVENGVQWAISRVNDYHPKLNDFGAESSNFRFRFKRMSFDDYLSNMPKFNGTKHAWDSEPIPACQQ